MLIYDPNYSMELVHDTRLKFSFPNKFSVRVILNDMPAYAFAHFLDYFCIPENSRLSHTWWSAIQIIVNTPSL